MKKRFISLLLSVLMLLSLVPVSAFAEGANISMTVTPASGKTMTTLQVGDTVTVVVSNTAMTVSSFTFNLAFDKDKFTCDSIVGADEEDAECVYIWKSETKTSELTEVSTVAGANTEGVVGFGMASSKDVAYIAHKIVTITFTAKAVGSADFTLNEDSSGTDGYKDTVSTTAATIIKTPIAAVVGAVDQPVKGQALDTTVDIGEVTAYTAAVAWYEGTAADGEAVTGNAKANQVYTAKITLTAKTDDGESFAASVTGPEGYTVNRVSASVVELTKTFAATANKTVTGIEITTAPDKTEYKVGENFDKTGMVVKATYDDASTNDAYTNYDVVGGDDLALGTTEVTIKSKDNEEATATQAITVSLNNGSDNLFVISDTLNLTYNGNNRAEAIKNAITCAAAVAGELGTPAYKFYDTNGDEVAAPTNAGTYTVKATAAAGTKYEAVTDLVIGTVTISPKALAESDFVISTTQDRTYDGVEKTVEYTSNGLTKDTDFTVSGTAAATNVGAADYTITFTGTGNYSGTINKTWNLTPATLTVDTAPTATGTYGTKANAFTVTGGTVKLGETTVSGTWSNTTTAETVFNAGNTTGKITVKFTPAANSQNYKELTATIVPTVGKADFTYTYGGKTTVVKGSTIAAVGGSVTATGVNNETVDGTLAWYTDDGRTVSATDAVFAEVTDSKTLYYKFTPDADETNYNNTPATGSVTFKVVYVEFTASGKAVAVGNGVTVKSSPTYGDTWAQIVTVKGIVAKVDSKTGTDESYTLDVTGSPDAGANQSYKVLYSGTIDGKTYTNVEVFAGTVTVAPKAISVTSSTKVTKVYDGDNTVDQNIEFVVSGVNGDGKFTVTATGNTYNNKDVGTGKAITLGTKTFPESIKESNYTLTYSATGAITAKAVAADSLTMAPATITKEYDAGTAAADLVFTFTGEGTDGTVTVNVTGNTYNNKNVGENKAITLGTKTFADSTLKDNYTITYPAVKGTITAKTVDVTIAGPTTAVYGDTYTKHTATAQLCEGDKFSGSVYYTLSGAASGSTTAPENAGSYVLSISGGSTNYIYNPTGVTAFAITAKDVKPETVSPISLRFSNTTSRTITASDLGISVAGTLSVVSVTDTDNLLGTKPNAGAVPTFALRNTLTAADAGKSFTIRVSFAPTSSNYTCSEAVDVVVNIIDKEAAAVTVNVADWTYDGTAHDATYSAALLSGTADSKKYTVSYTGIDGTSYGPSEKAPVDAGKYSVTVTYEDADNYGTKTEEFTVAKKALTFSAAVTGKTYDGNKTLAAATELKLVGLLKADENKVSLASTANTAELVDSTGKYDAGTYAATVTLDSVALTGAKAGNYELSGSTYTVTGVKVAVLVFSEGEGLITTSGTAVVAKMDTEGSAKATEAVSSFAKTALSEASRTDLGITNDMNDAEVTKVIKEYMAKEAGQSVSNSELYDLEVAEPNTKVVFAYPKGTGTGYTFVLTHLLNNGQVEVITLTALGAGLEAVLNSGSPYLLTWSAPAYSGSGSSSYISAGKTISTDLTGINLVKVDGKVVDSKYYTVNGGYVTLSAEFVNTLSAGAHKVTIENKTHVATATITVAGKTNVVSAKTGDTGVMMYAAMTVMSAAGAVWVTSRKKEQDAQ